MFTEKVYAGIDTTAGRRPVTCALLNARLQVIHLENHTFESLLSLLSGYPQIICGIDSPSRMNTGIMADPDYRQGLGLKRTAQRFSGYRVAEYEIRRRGIHIYGTPREISPSTAWIAEGWRLYGALRQQGFRDYPADGARIIFETYPHANYTALIGRRPYSKNSLEGRIQRQLVLLEGGVRVSDAMHLMEEWTRHRFLTGRIPIEDLYDHDQLDALIAAYTAYQLANAPESSSVLGDDRDGKIVLPVKDLKESY